jgi:DNA-binding NtrC family response regulator
MNSARQPGLMIIDDQYGAENKPTGHQRYHRDLFREHFERAGVRMHFSSAYDPDSERYRAERALADLEAVEDEVDLVILDILFGPEGRLGLEILQQLSTNRPGLPVIMMSSVERSDVGPASIEAGAIDYIAKPVDRAQFWQTVDRYLGVDRELWLIGLADVFLQAVDLAARCAEGGRTSVLLTGDSGTGKELFARYIHRHGPRRSGPFNAVDLSAVPEGLLEGTLFGHSRGAFTGADSDQVGELVRADGGVLFIDEIGNLPRSLQAKLLRVLEAREVRRVGDGATRPVDIQVVTATNEPISRLVKDGRFRADLYYRLAGSVLRLPNLRDRAEDGPLLTRHLMQRAGWERGIEGRVPSPSLLSQLPVETLAGNVRGLWQVVQSAFDGARGMMPTPQSLKAALEQRPRLMEQEWGPVTAPQGDRPEGLGSATAQWPCLSRDSVENARDQIVDLRARELQILLSLLEHSKGVHGSRPNRAAVAALLTGRERESTNVFDRRVRSLWRGLPPELRQRFSQTFQSLSEVRGLNLGEDS